LARNQRHELIADHLLVAFAAGLVARFNAGSPCARITLSRFSSWSMNCPAERKPDGVSQKKGRDKPERLNNHYRYIREQ
jgi:hypothetical protein